jgi:hypothetical protein
MAYGRCEKVSWMKPLVFLHINMTNPSMVPADLFFETILNKWPFTKEIIHGSHSNRVLPNRLNNRKSRTRNSLHTSKSKPLITLLKQLPPLINSSLPPIQTPFHNQITSSNNPSVNIVDFTKRISIPQLPLRKHRDIPRFR